MEIQWDNTISTGQIGTFVAWVVAGGAVFLRMHAAVVTMKLGLKALDKRQDKTEMALEKQTDLLIKIASVEQWKVDMERRVAHIEDSDLRVATVQRSRAVAQVIESQERVSIVKS